MVQYLFPRHLFSRVLFSRPAGKPVPAWSGPAILLIILLFGICSAEAHAAVSRVRKHSRTHKSAQSILNVPMPEEGVLLSDDDPLLYDVPNLFADEPKYQLKITRAHTGESLEVTYRIGDFYLPDALDQLDFFLRDNHDETVSECDPHLYDLLHTLMARVGKPDGTIEMLSGYRTQETNEMLRESHRTNAAEFSQHLYGRAIDIRMPGVPAARIRTAALSLKEGGVGYYPRGQFVHVDVGPVRHWTFIPHRGRRRAHKHKKK